MEFSFHLSGMTDFQNFLDRWTACFVPLIRDTFLGADFCWFPQQSIELMNCYELNSPMMVAVCEFISSIETRTSLKKQLKTTQ